MKKFLSQCFVSLLFIGIASFSYAQDGNIFGPLDWDAGGSDSVLFDPWVFDPGGDNSFPIFGGFDESQDNDFFGFDRFFDEFSDEFNAQDSDLVSEFNISQTQKNVTVRARVSPGVDPRDIAIAVKHGDLLNINVQNTQLKQETRENYNNIEWIRESFTRTVPLPTRVQSQKMITDYKDGVLNLTLPKSQ